MLNILKYILNSSLLSLFFTDCAFLFKISDLLNNKIETRGNILQLSSGLTLPSLSCRALGLLSAKGSTAESSAYLVSLYARINYVLQPAPRCCVKLILLHDEQSENLVATRLLTEFLALLQWKWIVDNVLSIHIFRTNSK